jgi:dephospho-CoA kinase
MTILNLKQAYCKLDKSQRFYNLERPIIGLTGGIATGKSTASKYLISKGFPLIDADSLVKKIYQQNETINFIKSIDNSYINSDQTINFPLLRKEFFQSDSLKQKVESFIYAKLPIVFREELKQFGPKGALIYDIPLLFEKSLESQFDLTLCIATSAELQLQRLMQRDGISETDAKAIITKQMPIDIKAQKSDLTVMNNSNINNLHKELDLIIQQISE